jgi:hypothetical protein
MRPEQLSWTGDIVHYESSPRTFRGFCRSCGTLYFRSDKWPSEVHVHAATLTEPGEYRLDAVVTRSYKMADRLPDPVHDGFSNNRRIIHRDEFATAPVGKSRKAGAARLFLRRGLRRL